MCRPMEGRSPLERVSVVVIALAATMWAGDAYFRNQLIGHLDTVPIVLAETAISALILAPLLASRWSELGRLSGRAWAQALVIALGPQALATVLFTASFKEKAFALTYVLLLTQPLFAVVLARVFLREHRPAWFWPLLAVALGAVYLIVFASDPGAPVAGLRDPRMLAALLALGASALWASGTVLGRGALATVRPDTLLALRFTLALPVLAIVVATGYLSEHRAYAVGDLGLLLGIALVSGVVSLLIYYRALRHTPASVATIAEMAFPVAATLVASAPAPWGFAQPVYPLQIAGTAVLMAVVLTLNWRKREVVSEPAAVVRLAQPA
jgi:DME family drug/metabolite transporter